MTQYERAHARVAHLIGDGQLIAEGEWRGRCNPGSGPPPAPRFTHLWSVGPDRFIADEDFHLTVPSQTHQEAHRADTAREIYDALPEKWAPFPTTRKARVAK